MTHRQIESLERRTLLSAAPTSSAQWAYAAIDGGPATVEDLATGNARRSGGGDGGGSTADAAIAYVTSDGKLKVRNADGSNPTLVWQQKRQPAAFPAWYPDGEQILFYTAVAGNGLYRVNVDGTGLTKVIATNYQSISSSDVSPITGVHGQHRIVFSDYEAPTIQSARSIWVANADGTGRTQLTFGGFDLAPSWSPDGQSIVYSRWSDYDGTGIERGLRLITLGEDAAGNVHVASDQLLVPVNQDLGGVRLGNPNFSSFSKTANKIYFHAPDVNVSSSFDIWAWDVTAAQLDRLTNTPGISERFVSGSEDDGKVVYEIEGTLYLANSDGSGSVALANGKGERYLLHSSFKRAAVTAKTSSLVPGIRAVGGDVPVPFPWSTTTVNDGSDEAEVLELV